MKAFSPITKTNNITRRAFFYYSTFFIFHGFIYIACCFINVLIIVVIEKAIRKSVNLDEIIKQHYLKKYPSGFYNNNNEYKVIMETK